MNAVDPTDGVLLFMQLAPPICSKTIYRFCFDSALFPDPAPMQIGYRNRRPAFRSGFPQLLEFRSLRRPSCLAQRVLDQREPELFPTERDPLAVLAADAVASVSVSVSVFPWYLVVRFARPGGCVQLLPSRHARILRCHVQRTCPISVAAVTSTFGAFRSRP